jgi:ABC-type metal ion transport system substrate-binding protein
MIKNILMIVIAGVLFFSFGCKSKRQQAAPPPPSAPKSIAVTMQEEAAEQITEKNMDSELEKMEKEITADANSPQ